MTSQPSRELKVVSGDAVIAVEENGSGDDTVLFSHGGFVTMALFDAPVASMADRFRCIRWDHRGQGASSGGSGWGRRNYLERIYSDGLMLIEHFDVTTCHWVGQSLGAYVGMRLAANRPDLVRSLVLLSPRVRANPLPFKLRMEAFSQLLLAARRSPLDQRVRDLLATQAMEELVGSTFMEDPASAEVRDHFQHDLSSRLTPAGVPALRGTVWYPENRPQMIAEISAPTLIIAGEDDHTSGSGVAHASDVHALIGHSTLVTVPGAGHAVLLEQPDIGSRIIKDFIASQTG